MNSRRIPDPFNELQRANPVGSVDPSSPDLARLRARLDEAIEQDRARRPRRGAFRWSGAGIVVGAGLAAAALVFALAGPKSAPQPPVPSAGNGGIGACVEQYDLRTLGNREWAFDGTVTSVSGDEVTFTVNDGFRGVGDPAVTLTAPGTTGGAITPGGGLSLVVGQRYLVAGNDTFVWSCGFTQPYDPAVAAAWSAALRP